VRLIEKEPREMANIFIYHDPGKTKRSLILAADYIWCGASNMCALRTARSDQNTIQLLLMTWMALCISAANCGKLMTWRVKALSLSQPKMHFWPNYMHRKPIMAELSNPHPAAEG
jgi:hypothetical protein